MESMANLNFARRHRFKIRELGNRLDIGRFRSHLFDFRLVPHPFSRVPHSCAFYAQGGDESEAMFRHRVLRRFVFDGLMIAGVADRPNFALKLTPFQFHDCGWRCHDAARRSPDFCVDRRLAGVGNVVVGQHTGMPAATITSATARAARSERKRVSYPMIFRALDFHVEHVSRQSRPPRAHVYRR